jgi:hypothetical protein
MKNNAPLNNSDLGRNMELVFEYVQQIFKETAQLMKKLDSLMPVGKDWMPTYGNRTTKEVTSHLEEPERWLVEASFRIYDSKKDPAVKKGITITYWGEDIDQPILIGGKIVYKLDGQRKGPVRDDHWDLWSLWFQEGEGKHITYGNIFKVVPQETNLKDYIQEAVVFAIPLASVCSEDDVKNKIHSRLVSL